MMETDSDALDCDLAETYQIYDKYQFSPKRIAVFSIGLPDRSRIKMKLSGVKAPLETVIQAACLDTLHLLLWIQSKDGQDGVNRPKSLVSELVNHEKKADFAVTPDEFEKLRNELMKGGAADG